MAEKTEIPLPLAETTTETMAEELPQTLPSFTPWGVSLLWELSASFSS